MKNPIVLMLICIRVAKEELSNSDNKDYIYSAFEDELEKAQDPVHLWLLLQPAIKKAYRE